MSIGPAMFPLQGNEDYLALHIDVNKHPFNLSTFWQIFSAIAYNLIDTPWMVRWCDHKVFNKYQMKRHNLQRIN